MDLAMAFPQRIVRVDASGDEELIQQEIRSIVGTYLDRSGLFAAATH
jgi:thymidylate kinase